MPCETCVSIQEKVQNARAEGNPEKERVMRVVLDNHRKIAHPREHNVVVVEPEAIIWPNGDRWEVR